VNPATVVKQTITIQPGPEEEKNSVVTTYNPDTHLGVTGYLYIGNGIGIYELTRSLLQFDLSDLPASAIIVNADLKLYQFDNSGTAYTSFSIAAHQVMESWDKFDITWNNLPSYRTSPESISAVAVGWSF
jgi:hypothetical protein